MSVAPAMAMARPSLALEIDFKHGNLESVASFLAGSAAALGRNDFSMPLKVLTDHWVDTVSDLRLLVSEGQLHTIGLPVRLCMWIEQEIICLAGQNVPIPTQIPSSIPDVVMEPVEVKRMPVVESKSSDDPYGIRYTYVSDFDENGILYSLGTFRGTKPWANPAELGIVTVTTSGLMPDSKPASAVVGREVVRCVTSSEENAWFCIDLIDIYVHATHYTLRHYSSWDTECIRDWKLEGSADGIMWYLLKEHKQDTALAAKGASHTWTITYDDPNLTLNNNRQFYRAFRIMMTGPNSNNHLYMCCSGFELYGLTLTKSQYEALPPAPVSGIASLPPSSSLLSSSSGVPVVQQQTLPDPFAFEYQHRFDFDSNGILYAIATNGNTTAWTNPADAGKLKVLASSMMEDSVPLSAVVGQDVVRCVTKPQPKSWIAIDLLDKTVQVTAYSLRHYSSWDTEALRYWRFEASMDGDKWHLLREHIGDEALNAKGATHTWPIDTTNPASRLAYRLFRILQTGENSNKHHYLSCSGFEIYGKLYQNDGHTRYEWAGVKRTLAPNELQFKYSGTDFDGRGIIHYLGIRDGIWSNPSIAGIIRVTASSLADDSTPVHATVGQDVVRCVTRPEQNSWFAWDFGTNRTIQPQAYTLRHYSSWDTEALRNWRFQGSIDGENWITIREHRDDAALDARGATHTWNVNCQRSFRHFRILQTGHNSNKHHYLALSGFELYGILITNPSASPSITPVIAPVEQKSVERVSYTWDTEAKGQFMQVLPGNVAKNSGSSDKWQMIRSQQNFSNGVHRIAIKIQGDENTSNTWRFILGVVPITLDCRGPKQWVGSGGSWGYIAGTGGKCHNKAESQVYGAKYGMGNVIGIVLDFTRGTITFYKNGDSQGVAYTNLLGPVHIAASMTATDSMVALVDWVDPLPISVSNTATWDIHHKSAFLAVDERTATVRNSGSSDKWQSVRSVRAFTYEDGAQHRFDVEILENPKTPNSWQIIVGVVPASFTCQGSKQWVGAGESWGYIAGTGGKCFNAPKSIDYGEPYGRTGDVITVILDFAQGTIEFLKNGASQGIAFKTLTKQPVYAAVSLTATGATARLRI